ncbi:MAG TPA: 5-oxoprolinase subunit PxpB [Rhodanobacteraceae bacterium]
MADYTIETLAEDALLVRFGDVIDVTLNAQVHAAASALRRAQLVGVVDIAPAYATLMLRFDMATTSSPQLRAQVDDALAGAAELASSPRTTTREGVEIPVCYGGDYGTDLVAVAAYANLTPSEVIALHTAAIYTVAMLGFAPGFPYLLGLDPRLHVPRRSDPRVRVPAGSIAIGGAQTGVYPSELPGGWQLIGRTPAALFDPARDPPCLLMPGDKVRLYAIAEHEFAAHRANHDA